MRQGISIVVATCLLLGPMVCAADLTNPIRDIASSDVATSSRAIDETAERGEDGGAAVPALLQALSRPEEEVRWRAARALGEIRAPAATAVPALLKALEDPAERVRAHSANSLGRLASGSDDAVVDRLLLLVFDQAPVVRQAALRALQALDPPRDKVLPTVLKLLEESDPAVLMPALQAVVELGPSVVPDLLEALRNERAAYWACLVLAEFGPDAKDAVPLLGEVLKHPEEEVRMQALVTLGEIGPAAATQREAIVSLLKNDPFGGVRYAATFALGMIGLSDEATAVLQQAMESDDELQRILAAFALVRNNPHDKPLFERTVGLIVAGLKSHDVQVRRMAARAAVELHAPADEVAPLLIDALEDPDPDVVGNALQALADQGPRVVQQLTPDKLRSRQLRPYAVLLIQELGPEAEGAVPALLEVLGDRPQNDEDLEFRRELLFALGAIGPAAKDAVPALVRVLSEDSPEIRSAASLALGRMGAAARAAVPALRQNLSSQEPLVRLMALRALLQIQPGERSLAVVAVPLLLNALSDENEWLRAEAAASLGDTGELGRSAIPRLRQLLQDDSELVREAAANSLKKLGG